MATIAMLQKVKKLCTRNTCYSLWRQKLFSDTCLSQEKLPCKNTKRCFLENKTLLCNTTSVLCLSREVLCDSVKNCLGDDVSDEYGCKYIFYYKNKFLNGQISGWYIFWKSGFIVGTAITSIVTSLLCLSHHNNALRKRNMVRYNKDVIKRKDIVKLKKIQPWRHKK